MHVGNQAPDGTRRVRGSGPVRRRCTAPSGSRERVRSLAVVGLALSYRLALTPALAETYYDETLTELMAVEILRGVPQVFYVGRAAAAMELRVET